MPKSNKRKKEIYLDNASATPMDMKVFSAMANILKGNPANTSSIHEQGIENKKKLEEARSVVAKILGAHSDEIIFTSGATESNNLAISGATAQYFNFYHPCALPANKSAVGTLGDSKNQNTALLPHIITTNIEHSSVLEICRYLEKKGQAEITYVPVEANGIVDPKKIKKAIKPNTILVSVMYANNEIGTIQPIREIAKEIRHYRKTKNQPKFSRVLGLGPDQLENFSGSSFSSLPLFHTDATQAINYLPINVEKLGVDLMSFNGGKIYGPKGIGALYIKRKIPIKKIIFGGDQEFGLRAGTENLAGIVGLAEALKITEKIKEKESKRLIDLRNYFCTQMSKMPFDIRINGDLENRLPNNINITIPKIPSDLLVMELSARGIYVSEKSACKSGEKAGSYVIKAISRMENQKGKLNISSLRFSLGRQTTKADLEFTLKALSEILKKLKKWYT